MKKLFVLSFIILISLSACGINPRTDFTEKEYGEHAIKNHLDFEKKGEKTEEHKGIPLDQDSAGQTEAQSSKEEQNPNADSISTEKVQNSNNTEEGFVAKEIVEKGDKVKVLYKGSLDNGEVFDSNTKENPLEFEVMTGQMIPGFDKAMLGMKINETKKIRIEAKEAYGERDEKKIIDFPKDQVPKDLELKEGQVVPLTDPTGQTVKAKIVGFKENSITFDMNHPLAGEALNFEITLLEVKGKL